MEHVSEGVKLTNPYLRVRVMDNAPRLIHHVDMIMPGNNGLAFLFDRKHHKNIFSQGGLQYVAGSVRPSAAPGETRRFNPTQAPMTLSQTGPDSARLFQSARDCGGLNTQIDFELADRRIDQTITFWGDEDLDGFDTFWSSQLNQVQCTSLFLQGKWRGEDRPRWLEAASAGHSKEGRVYYRPFDPTGKGWAEHLVDNPVLRQKHAADEGTVAATLKAGFETHEPNKVAFTGFYYGVIDDYVFLMIFREPAFYFWTACGGATQRNPTWAYGIAGQPAKAGERLSYHARLVFKPFAGVEDLLAEVRAFRGDDAVRWCGEA